MAVSHESDPNVPLGVNATSTTEIIHEAITVATAATLGSDWVDPFADAPQASSALSEMEHEAITGGPTTGSLQGDTLGADTTVGVWRPGDVAEMATEIMAYDAHFPPMPWGRAMRAGDDEITVDGRTLDEVEAVSGHDWHRRAWHYAGTHVRYVTAMFMGDWFNPAQALLEREALFESPFVELEFLNDCIAHLLEQRADGHRFWDVAFFHYEGDDIVPDRLGMEDDAAEENLDWMDEEWAPGPLDEEWRGEPRDPHINGPPRGRAEMDEDLEPQDDDFDPAALAGPSSAEGAGPSRFKAPDAETYTETVAPDSEVLTDATSKPGQAPSYWKRVTDAWDEIRTVKMDPALVAQLKESNRIAAEIAAGVKEGPAAALVNHLNNLVERVDKGTAMASSNFASNFGALTVKVLAHIVILSQCQSLHELATSLAHLAVAYAPLKPLFDLVANLNKSEAQGPQDGETLWGSAVELCTSLLGHRTTSEMREDQGRMARIRILSDTMRAAKEVKTYVGAAWEYVCEALDAAYTRITKKPGFLSAQALRTEYDGLFGRFVALSGKNQDLAIDHKKFDAFRQLQMDHMDLHARMLPYKEFGAMVAHLEMRALVLTGILDAAMLAMQSRSAPAILMIGGHAGQGKSYALETICAGIWGLYSPGVPFDTKLMYVKAPTTDYWEGYCGQPFMIVDDFGQNKEAVAITESILDVIRMGNRAPYALNMADLKNKGKFFFKSPFVLLSTNLQHAADIATLASGAAFTRRINLHLWARARFDEQGRRIEGADGMVYKMLQDYRFVDAEKETHFLTVCGRITKKQQVLALEAKNLDAWNKATNEDCTTLDINDPKSFDADGNWIGASSKFQHIDKMRATAQAATAILRDSAPADEAEMPQKRSIDLGLPFDRTLAKARGYNKDEPFWHRFSFSTDTKMRTDPSYQASKANLGFGTYTSAFTYRTFGQIMADERVSWWLKPLQALGSVCGIVIHQQLGPAFDLFAAMTLIAEKPFDGFESYLDLFTWTVPAAISMAFVYLAAMQIYPMVKAMFVANQAEGPYNKTDSVRRLRTRRVKKMGEANSAEFDSKQTPQVIQTADHGIVTLQLLSPSDTGKRQIHTSMSACHIHEGFYLVPKHYMDHAAHCLKYKPGDWVLRMIRERDYHEAPLADILIQNSENRDLVLFRMPKTVPPLPSLLNHYVDESDLDKDFSRGHMVVRNLKNIETRYFTDGRFEREVAYVWKDPAGNEHTEHPVNVFTSSAPSQKGDCGSLEIVDNDRVRGKIFGMHIARCGGRAAAVIVTRQWLEDAIEEFREDIGQAQMAPPFKYGNAALNVQPIANKADIPYVQHGTAYKRSKIDGVPTNFPSLPEDAKLRVIDGKKVYPLMDAAARATVTPVASYDEEAFRATKEEMPFLMRTFFGVPDSRPLSDHDNLNGNDDPFIKAININTSPGYVRPLQDKPGKRRYLDSEEPGARTFNKRMRDDIAKMEEDLKWSPHDVLSEYMEDPPIAPAMSRLVTFMLMLKDEILPEEKVRVGKVRGTWVAPAAYLVLFRRHFLRAWSTMQRSCGRSPCAIGINPEDAEMWTNLARYVHLDEPGWFHGAGDLGNMDGNWLKEVHEAIREAILQWMEGPIETEELRRNLLAVLQICECVVGGHFYAINCNHRTGEPITALYNTLLLIFGLAYSWRAGSKRAIGYYESWDRFIELVRIIGYGDDNVWAVHESAMWFNCHVVAAGFGDLGMNYTHPLKNRALPEFFNREDITFLKREFVLDRALGVYRAPLDMRTIDNMVYWVNKKGDEGEHTTQVCEAALREWFMWGRPIFQARKHFLNSQLARAGYKQSHLVYEDLENAWLGNRTTVDDYEFVRRMVRSELIGEAEMEDAKPRDDDFKPNIVVYDRAGFTVALPGEAEMGEKATSATKEEVTESKEGVVSGVARRVGTVASFLKFIPGIGTIAAAVEAGAGVVGGVAGALGLSNPPLLTAPTPTVPTVAPYRANTDAGINVQVLASSTTNRIADGIDEIGEDFSRNPILATAGWPCLIAHGAIDNTTGEDSVFDGYYITPNQGPGNGIQGGGATQYVSMTHLAWPCQFARWWRGSITFHFQFFANEMIMTRVRLTFHPSLSTIPSTISGSVDGDVYSMLVEIKGDTMVSVTIPQLSRWRWIPTGQPMPTVPLSSIGSAKSVYENQSTGFITLSIANPVTTATTANQTIYYCTWISAGPDFEVAQHRGPSANVTYNDTPPPSVTAHGRNNMGEAQMGEVTGDQSAVEASETVKTMPNPMLTTLDSAIIEDTSPIPNIPTKYVANPYSTPEIAELSRVYQIDTIAFQNTSVFGTQMAAYNLLTQYLGVPKIQDTVARWRFIAFDGFEILVKILATGVHTGGIMFAWSSFTDCTTDVPLLANGVWGASCSRNARMSFNKGVSMTFKVMNNMPTDFIDLGGHAGGEAGAVVAYSLAPLTTTAASPSTQLNLAVYIRAINPRVAGPTLDTFSLPLNNRARAAEEARRRHAALGQAEMGEGGTALGSEIMSNPLFIDPMMIVPATPGQTTGVTMGEVIKEWLQLFHRLDYARNVTVNTSGPIYTNNVEPSGNLNLMLRGWRWWRGSIVKEHVAMTRGSVTGGVTTPTDGLMMVGHNDVDSGTLPLLPNGAPAVGGEGAAYTHTAINPVLRTQLPFYSQVRFLTTSARSSSYTGNYRPDQYYVSALLPTGGTTWTLTAFEWEAAGDDFSWGEPCWPGSASYHVPFLKDNKGLRDRLPTRRALRVDARLQVNLHPI